MRKTVFKNPKTTLSILILLGVLPFVSIFIYNQKRIVFAQEEKEPSPLVCEEVIGVDFRSDDTEVRVRDPENRPLSENLLEIPIGQSTESIEDIAQQIIDDLEVLIGAAASEAGAAEKMSDYISQCGTAPNYDCDPNCKLDSYFDTGSPKCKCIGCGSGWDECPGSCPAGCPPDEWCDAYKCCCPYVNYCKPDWCTGPACPSGIAAELGHVGGEYGIIPSAEVITEKYDEIDDHFLARFWPATLSIVQYGAGTVSEVLNIISVPGWPFSGPLDQASKDLCSWLHSNRSDIEKLLCIAPIYFETTGTTQIDGKLDKARHRLAECVIKPGETEKIMRGEEPGRFLMSCLEVLNGHLSIHSFLDGELKEDKCFGNLYCLAEGKGHPCAEDFYCCGMIRSE